MLCHFSELTKSSLGILAGIEASEPHNSGNNHSAGCDRLRDFDGGLSSKRHMLCSMLSSIRTVRLYIVRDGSDSHQSCK